ncbi:MAG: hypothetical protein JNK05_05820 [Myxococcales bacterium]|nr:hypothetical protein [Myxococcales bacterium]
MRSRSTGFALFAACALARCESSSTTHDASAPTDSRVDSRDAIDPPRDAIELDQTAPDVTADVTSLADTPVVDSRPRVEYMFDLDRDGRSDTNLALRACAGSTATCLAIDSSVVASSEVQLSAMGSRCAGSLVATPIRVLSNHTGDAMSEIAVAHCIDQRTSTPPALTVVDPSAHAIVAQTIAPSTQKNAWVDVVRGADDKLYPFLAPSYGDGDTSGTYGTAIWGRMCIFRAGAASTSPCGAGWIAGDTTLPSMPGWFREVGGYMQDLDGDRWDDVTLTYHAVAHAISGRTGAVLGTLSYDVASGMAPAFFHSGRNYGTHSATRAPDGTLRTTIVAGAPVGTFDDYNCNVSRFIAVLDARAGTPSSRRLAWTRYMGFASTIFNGPFTSEFAANPASRIARPADAMNNCVHRFSDSRSVIDGVDSIVVNYFRQDAPVDLCLALQYDLYVPPAWTDAKSTAWYSCFARNVRARGTWGMMALRESDGQSVTGGLEVYVWGRSDRLVPSGETIYLVERLPGPGFFDLSDRAPSALSALSLVRGLFQNRGVFPSNGRPAIRQVSPSGSVGVGSYTYIAELDTQDADGDGLLDVRMRDGRWIGWDRSTNAWVVK